MMQGLAVLLIAAAAGYALARWLSIPAIPALLAAGIVLTILGVVPTALIEQTLVLGATFLLFVTGIEMNPSRTRAQRPVALRVGAIQFFVHALLGFAVSMALGFGPIGSFYLALAITASSTLLVIRLLQSRGQLFEPFARLVVGVLLLQDLLVILLIPLVTNVADGVPAMIAGLLATVSLIVLAWAFHRFVAPLILRLHDNESMILTILAVLFVFVGVADALELPLITGAFLGGVALSTFPVSGAVRSQLGSIADFFAALFYVALGALVAVPTPDEIGAAIVLAALVLIATPPIVAFIAERYGFSGRQAIEAGLLLAQTSEISLVIGLYGLVAGQIPGTIFNVIALVTAITMVATPFITADRVVWWLMRLHPVRAQTATTPIPESGHILLLGTGTTGLPLLETLMSAGESVVVVDDDPVLIERLRDADVPCIRGDASDVEVLREAHADRARIISSTIRRPHDNRRLLEFARGVPVLVRVFDDHDAQWIRELGGIPIVYSEAAAEEMIRWFDATHARQR
jgi:CPA2 family monovalent cation:H+ antiporter-2